MESIFFIFKHTQRFHSYTSINQLFNFFAQEIYFYIGIKTGLSIYVDDEYVFRYVFLLLVEWF